ncbi:EAL domain protein [compost metagenome]
MAQTARARVIAEGVELVEELQVLAGMGVDLVQGYLLGRPQEKPASERPIDLKIGR